MYYPFLAASLAGRGEGEHEAGSAVENWRGLQHLPHGWKQRPQDCKKWGVQDGMEAPEATQISEEQSIVWNESQEGTHFPSWFSWTQLPNLSQGEVTSPSPVTLLSDGRASDRSQTTTWENHGWETPPVSLLHSHQMRCRYYTSSLPSVGFACTCYNLIRRKLDFLC